MAGDDSKCRNASAIHRPSGGFQRINRCLAGACVALLLGLTFLLGCFANCDMDIWWHLKTGARILAGQGIPRSDTFTFGASGSQWIDLHWGFQLVSAWIYGLGGFPALTLSTAGCAVASIIVALIATQVWQRPATVALCWLPALGLMSSRFYVRPEIVTLLCLAAILATLHHAERYPRLAWLLTPIQILWVNCQGLFVLGLVLLGCWWVELLMRGERREMRRWFAPTVAAVAACLLNPFTWRGALFPLTLFSRLSSEHEFYAEQAAELLSMPQYLARYGADSIYVWLSLLVFVTAGLSFLAPVRWRTFRLLAFLAFSWLGLLATRNQPQFAMVAGTVLVWNVSDWLRQRPCPSAYREAVTSGITVSVLVCLLVLVGTGRFYVLAGEGRLIGLNEHPFWHAHGAARMAALEGMPRHVVAMHLGQASVFEFHMRPDQRVYVDPRLEVMPRAALENYSQLQREMVRGDSGWKTRLQDFPQLPALLVDHRTHHAAEATLLADPDWQCVWFDDTAGVYVSRSEHEVVQQHGLDLTDFFLAQPSGVPIEPDSSSDYVQQVALLRIAQDLLAREKSSLARVLLLSSMRQASGAKRDRIVGAASCCLYDGPPDTISPSDWRPLDLLAAARVRRCFLPIAEHSEVDFETWFYLATVAGGLKDQRGLTDALAGMRLSARTLTQRRVVRQLQGQVADVAHPRSVPTSVNEPLAVAQSLINARQFLAALQVLGNDRVRSDFESGSTLWADCQAKLLLIAGKPESARAVWGSAEESNPGLFSASIGAAYLVERRYDEALDCCRRTPRDDPRFAEALCITALCHLERGEAEETANACRAALALADLRPHDKVRCQWILEVVETYGTGQGTAELQSR